MKNKIFKRVISLVLSVGCVFSVACIATVNASAATTDTVTKRALVLAAPDEPVSPFVEQDVPVMKKAFSAMGINAETYVNNGGTTSLIKNKFQSVFGSAKSSDVNYLYITSHGNATGLALNGYYKSEILFSELRSMLDKFAGRFVIMIDACEAGGAIAKSSGSVSRGMIESFFHDENISFSTKSSDNFGKNLKYTVFCSSFADEYSYGGIFCSVATFAWAWAMGYDSETDTIVSSGTDANNDTVITPAELYSSSLIRQQYYYTYLSNSTHIQNMCYYSPYVFCSVFFKTKQLGDVNGDGKWTAADVLLIRKYIVGQNVLQNGDSKFADLNCDNKVTAQDVNLLRKFIAGQTC